MAKVTYDFTGKRALVTGAGRGIGRGICEALLKAGAETIALSKIQEELDSLVAEFPKVHPVCVDLANWKETREAVEKLGPIDMLVNNAGVAIIQSFLDVTEEGFDESFAVNVKAIINVSQAVVKGMIERKCHGSIVNISSQSSYQALKNHTVYCATKAAVDGVTRNMAFELASHQIRVNSVNPTAVLTVMGRIAWSDPARGVPMKNRIPLGRFAEVPEVAGPVLYLLSDSSSMVTGTTFIVDGGMTAACV